MLNISNSGLTNIGKTIFLIIYISNLFETEYIVALAIFLKNAFAILWGDIHHKSHMSTGL